MKGEQWFFPFLGVVHRSMPLSVRLSVNAIVSHCTPASMNKKTYHTTTATIMFHISIYMTFNESLTEHLDTNYKHITHAFLPEQAQKHSTN